MNFFKHGVSIDESRVSILLLSFIVTVGFSLWQFYHKGTIDGGILTLIAYQIGAITGINVVDKITNRSSLETNPIDEIREVNKTEING
jgi:hypothetical protein